MPARTNRAYALRTADAYAETSFLSRNRDDALARLCNLPKHGDFDDKQRDRVAARIAYIIPITLEMQGRRPQVTGDDGLRASLP